MSYQSGNGEGLVLKFKVERVKPSSRGIDHSNCEYFVLDPKHDPIARQVMSQYAQVADQIGEKQLAADMYKWLADLCQQEPEGAEVPTR